MNKAERIYQELRHEQASVWYINDEFGAKIMIKLPSSTVKAIIKGCRVEFIFGKDDKSGVPVFHTGLIVYDDEVHYLTIVGPSRFIDEHESLSAIMNRSFTAIHFHDELNACVVTAEVTFTIKDQLKVLNLLGNTDNLYVGDFTQKISDSLNCFEYSVNPTKRYESEIYSVTTVFIEPVFRNWAPFTNTFIGTKAVNTFLIDDADEGTMLEKQIFTVLDHLFKDKLYKSPQVIKGLNKRELTDVLGLSAHGDFLIETKALGIDHRYADKSMDKKVRGLQKQIVKGIDQLVGANKQIKKKSKIVDIEGNGIDIEDTHIPHCIVLVSELLPFGEWSEVIYNMLKAMSENRMYLNVIDFRQFMQFVGYSKGNPDQLNLFLIERVEKFVETQSIHLEFNFIQE